MTPDLKQKLSNLQCELQALLGLEDLAEDELIVWATEVDDDWIWFQIQKERHRRGLLPDRIQSRDGKFIIRMNSLPVM